ncbi:MAG: hypothetical protein SFH39_10030 [Candidatus Magnetobacterium sp. LHC-1]
MKCDIVKLIMVSTKPKNTSEVNSSPQKQSKTEPVTKSKVEVVHNNGNEQATTKDVEIVETSVVEQLHNQDNAVSEDAKCEDLGNISKHRYFVDEMGRLCRETEGFVHVLTNFDARIVKDIVDIEGEKRTRVFTVNIKLPDGKVVECEVPATQLESYKWLRNACGADVILYNGNKSMGDISRAIMLLSNGRERFTRYRHTGWCEIDGKWVYLTHGSCLGGDSVMCVLPPELERYSLPSVVDESIENDAIKASLSFCEIGKEEITYPLLAYTYLTPLTTIIPHKPNFALCLAGESGVFKSALALLLCSHYGDFGSVESLQSFSDTSNALEKRGHTLKDVVMCVDDYYPSESKSQSV